MQQKVHGLEQYRVLCAMLALEEFTTKDLAKFSGVKETTVSTIVSRKKELLDQIGTQPTGRRGGQFTRYRMNAASSLRSEISDVLGQLPALEPEVESSTVELTPVNLLAAEDALLRLFPQADNDEERQGLLRLAQLNINAALDDADSIRAASDRREAPVLDARLRAVQSLRDLARAELDQVNKEDFVGDVVKKVVDRARLAIADLHRLNEEALADDIADRVGASRIVSASVLSGSNLEILKTWDAPRFKEWLLGCAAGGASVPLVFRPTSVFILEVRRLFDAANTTVQESVFKIGLISALHEWKINAHGLYALRALIQIVRLLGAAGGVRRVADLAVIDLTRHSEKREAKKLYVTIIRTLQAFYFVEPAADALHTLFFNDKYVRYAGHLFVGACRANPDKCQIYLERLFHIHHYLYSQLDIRWILSLWLREVYPVHLLRSFPALTVASADRLIALFDEISLDAVLSSRVKDVSESLFYQDHAAKYAHTLFRILCRTARADWPRWVNRLNDLGEQGIEVDFPAAAKILHSVISLEEMAEKFALVASADRFTRAFTAVIQELSPPVPHKPKCAAAEDGFVPSTIPVAPSTRESGKDDRVTSPVMGAEASWIAEHEKLLLQRLREPQSDHSKAPESPTPIGKAAGGSKVGSFPPPKAKDYYVPSMVPVSSLPPPYRDTTREGSTYQAKASENYWFITRDKRLLQSLRATKDPTKFARLGVQ